MNDLELYKNKIIELADMCLDFGKVQRVTLHQDGLRPETDTDHTVMLAVIATTLADKFYKNILDIGLVSQFAVVHDLLEVYAGDTDTLTNTSKENFIAKDKREAEAFLRIQEKFGATFPYLCDIINRREKQEDIEAKFVKVCDKMMSKATSILNYNTYPKSKMTKQELETFLEKQISIYGDDRAKVFPEIFSLFDALNEEMLKRF